MAKTKRPGAPGGEKRLVGPRGSPLFKGLRKVMVSLRPDQVDELYEEATARADRAKKLRSDVSEIVREAIDLWLSKRR